MQVLRLDQKGRHHSPGANANIRIAAKRTALDAISTRLPEPAGGKAAAFEGEGNQKRNQVGMPQNRAVTNLLN
jgi:hypothetical protein